MKIHSIDVTGEAGQELIDMVALAILNSTMTDLASILRVECDECGGDGMSREGTWDGLPSTTRTCSPCKGEGTRTILSIWEARYGRN